jgi:hypothetical protein
MIYLRCNALSADGSWPGTRPAGGMSNRSRQRPCIGDPNVGEFKDAVILKTFGEVATISNGSDAHVTSRKGEYCKSRLDREFPYQVMLPVERYTGIKSVAMQNFSRI